MKLILGIETSCDETSMAILQDDQVLSHVTASQINQHQAFGGVYPELASRLHTENLGYVLKATFLEAKVKPEDLSAIAVTRGPGLIGALHIGLQTAKVLASYLSIPLIGVHHHAAHLEAVRFHQPIRYPALGLIVSGGHTELVYMKAPLSYELIGQTQDDAVGESYDKVARMLGLGYPGGPLLDQLAQRGKPGYELPYPKTVGRFDVSFSGLKTAVASLIYKEQQQGRIMDHANLAYAFQKVVITTLIERLTLALDHYVVQSVVIGGGVSLNSALRKACAELEEKRGIPMLFPPSWACTDNGAMIALLGGTMMDHQVFSPMTIGVDPSWELDAFITKNKL